MREKGQKALRTIPFSLIIISAILYAVFHSGEYYAADSNVPCSTISVNEYTVVDDSLLNIFYFCIGQGDSTLVMKNGTTMLIDGGNHWDGERLTEYLRTLNVERIDYLIASHMHADHIGGLDTIVENFEIGNIFRPKAYPDTRQAREFLEAIEANDLEYELVNIGDVFYIGGARSEIMFVDNVEQNDINATCIVIQITYGDQTFLFMADAEKHIEEYREWDEVDVLRVGHHGSNTSSSEAFLEQTNPEVAIISVGYNNNFNHPHQPVLDRLNNIGAIIYRTDKNGTVWLVSDGINNRILTER